MSDASESSLKNLGVFSTLHSATEVRYFLLAVTFVLLIDNVFIGLNQPSLFDLTVNPTLMASSNLAIKVILIFVGFSFLASLVLPLVTAVLHDIYFNMIHPVFDCAFEACHRFFGSADGFPIKREHDGVYLHELKNEAYETMDKYYLDLYEKHVARWYENRKSMNEHTLFSTFCLIMLCWNYALSTPKNSAISVVFANYFGSPKFVWVGVIALFILTVARYFERYKPSWIDCPPLYKKIQKQEDKKVKNHFNRF